MWWFIAVYAVAAVVCFYVLYANGLDLNFRLKNRHDPDKSEWQNFLSDQKEVVRIFKHDFFGLHCPWSWKRCVPFRVAHARSLLENCTHEKGWAPTNCDDPANHDRIAYDCFVSRTRFWCKHIMLLCIAPLQMITAGVIACAALFALCVYGAGAWVWAAVARRQSEH